ncbi:hypothetical protein AB0F18_23925 [Streptomyces sp. NPDC029216]|uniref:hypothetical protein n=1 Tax=Streptomyces sp. NPDC029216 TaxID=3154701 RepID=UPI0033D76E8D
METMPGSDPDRAGFTIALEAVRGAAVSLVDATVVPTPSAGSDLAGHIGAHACTPCFPGAG